MKKFETGLLVGTAMVTLSMAAGMSVGGIVDKTVVWRPVLPVPAGVSDPVLTQEPTIVYYHFLDGQDFPVLDGGQDSGNFVDNDADGTVDDIDLEEDDDTELDDDDAIFETWLTPGTIRDIMGGPYQDSNEDGIIEWNNNRYAFPPGTTTDGRALVAASAKVVQGWQLGDYFSTENIPTPEFRQSVLDAFSELEQVTNILFIERDASGTEPYPFNPSANLIGELLDVTGDAPGNPGDDYPWILIVQGAGNLAQGDFGLGGYVTGTQGDFRQAGGINRAPSDIDGFGLTIGGGPANGGIYLIDDLTGDGYPEAIDSNFRLMQGRTGGVAGFGGDQGFGPMISLLNFGLIVVHDINGDGYADRVLDGDADGLGEGIDFTDTTLAGFDPADPTTWTDGAQDVLLSDIVFPGLPFVWADFFLSIPEPDPAEVMVLFNTIPGVVRHVILRALGFEIENQRPIRNEYYETKFGNIELSYIDEYVILDPEIPPGGASSDRPSLGTTLISATNPPPYAPNGLDYNPVGNYRLEYDNAGAVVDGDPLPFWMGNASIYSFDNRPGSLLFPVQDLRFDDYFGRVILEQDADSDGTLDYAGQVLTNTGGDDDTTDLFFRQLTTYTYLGWIHAGWDATDPLPLSPNTIPAPDDQTRVRFQIGYQDAGGNFVPLASQQYIATDTWQRAEGVTYTTGGPTSPEVGRPIMVRLSSTGAGTPDDVLFDNMYLFFCNEPNFQLYVTRDENCVPVIDAESVMGYANIIGSLDAATRPTFTVLDPFTDTHSADIIGQQNQLSSGDIDALREIYGFVPDIPNDLCKADVDGTPGINSDDVLFFFQAYFSCTTTADAGDCAVADMTGDGRVDIDDIIEFFVSMQNAGICGESDPVTPLTQNPFRNNGTGR